MDAELHSERERQLVVFTLANESYGVAITTVKEIITMQRVTPLPKSPPYVKGLINLRGRVIPVIDLKARLNLPETDVAHDTRIMVIEVGDRTIGCIVDAVREVLTIRESVVEPVTGTDGGTDYLEGIAKIGDELVILIDLQRVVGGEQTQLHRAG